MPNKDKNSTKFLTGQFGIPNTSYQLQLGSKNGQYIFFILQNTNVVNSYIIRDEDIKDGIPDHKILANLVYRTINIPINNIDLYILSFLKLVFPRKREKSPIMAPISSQPRFFDKNPMPSTTIPPNPPGSGGVGKRGGEFIINKEKLNKDFCKYCGTNLVDGQSICHVCRNKID